MLLNNVKLAFTTNEVNIRVTDGKIAQISPGHFTSEELTVSFDNAIIFPGLINSHDHLDFNLFPALGDTIYNNYTEWGTYIHKNYKDKIAAVLKVPSPLRNQWGIYKNLLCGVTTVVNHGKKIKDQSSLITVYQDCQSIHSVQFERKWKLALNNPLKKNLPVVIHTGEGTDVASLKEIDKLISWNFLKRALIGVHGVAITENQVKAFKALVWCPWSNYFLLNQTAPVNRLKKHTALLFGTDSTLTGDWNIWDHIRLARKTKFLVDKELFDTLTINAANIWKLNIGEIAENRDADLVVAKMKNGSSANSFFEIDPEDILMVIHKGKISLFDEELIAQLNGINLKNYSRININGTSKYIQGNLPELMQKIKQYYPEASFPVI
jgi:cytosine/adenosine deaminase-related metal-dependent hydrolase